MLSVVIPVYNEEKRLRDTLAQVALHLQQLAAGDFEIVVSDDGSTDQSVAIAEAAEWPVRVLRSSLNQGKGAAVIRGMTEARGDIAFFFDADLSTPLEEIDRFLAEFERGEWDVIIGTRKHPQANIQRPQPWYRVWLGLAYTKVVHLMTGTRFSDYTCGFKAFRKTPAREVFRRSRIRGWSFDAEILFLTQKMGFSSKEIPVSWSDEPDTRVRLFRAILRSFWELLVIRYHQLRGRYR